MTGTSRLPRFVRDPRRPQLTRLDWWEQAAARLATGKALHLAVGLWLMASLRRSPTVMVTRRTMQRVNISRYAAGDALRCLEAAGLVKVWRLPGRSPKVTMVEPGTATPLRIYEV